MVIYMEKKTIEKEWYNNPQKDIVVQWKERYKLAMKIQQSIIDKII